MKLERATLGSMQFMRDDKFIWREREISNERSLQIFVRKRNYNARMFDVYINSFLPARSIGEPIFE